MAAARKSAAARVRAAAEDVVEMCAEHFPHGWRHVDEHQDAVACEHGGWARPSDEQPELAVPAQAPTEGPEATEPETPPES